MEARRLSIARSSRLSGSSGLSGRFRDLWNHLPEQESVPRNEEAKTKELVAVKEVMSTAVAISLSTDSIRYTLTAVL
ncbi:hypothetical protein FVEN_g13120 [Fusarium venenatum]|uniref:Uncharacterized protein n=1 Tax=Fusarium venenatum TaxID=56646 RepID=A0A2L2TUL9_9HYPO|nr:uncharacterized protein FVRRES_01642 [Fusarium venenatum]KAG8350305.1 hypothetical protein FVEN_g13120 [Fusarium venenatum]CEI65130.1 unnamed protein product [Fusarium venenatum]